VAELVLLRLNKDALEVGEIMKRRSQ